MKLLLGSIPAASPRRQMQLLLGSIPAAFLRSPASGLQRRQKLGGRPLDVRLHHAPGLI
jgi:hypothetical protein